MDFSQLHFNCNSRFRLLQINVWLKSLSHQINSKEMLSSLRCPYKKQVTQMGFGISKSRAYTRILKEGQTT